MYRLIPSPPQFETRMWVAVDTNHQSSLILITQMIPEITAQQACTHSP